MDGEKNQRRTIDALNGSLMSPKYLQEAIQNGVLAMHITVNNFVRSPPIPP